MIYFIQQAQSGNIKIGYTSKDDVSQRLLNLQTASAEKLIVLGVLKDGTQKTEVQLHSFFAIYHINGEWFRPDANLLGCLIGLAEGKDFYLETARSTEIAKQEIIKSSGIIKTTLKESRQNAVDEIERKYIGHLLKAGKRIKDIAVQAGMTTRQVHNLMTKHGLTKAGR